MGCSLGTEVKDGYGMPEAGLDVKQIFGWGQWEWSGESAGPES